MAARDLLANLLVLLDLVIELCKVLVVKDVLGELLARDGIDDFAFAVVGKG